MWAEITPHGPLSPFPPWTRKELNTKGNSDPHGPMAQLLWFKLRRACFRPRPWAPAMAVPIEAAVGGHDDVVPLTALEFSIEIHNYKFEMYYVKFIISYSVMCRS